jgi:hypothetical protein
MGTFLRTALLSLLAALFACTPAVGPGQEDLGRIGPSEDVEAAERSFNPLGWPGDLENVPARGLPERYLSGGVGDTTRLTPEQSSMSLGFRVQAFASASRDEAQRVAGEVRAVVDQPVYVELHESYYKVRVGDCTTPDCATRLRDILRTSGYEDAWVVKTKVIVP